MWLFFSARLGSVAVEAPKGRRSGVSLRPSLVLRAPDALAAQVLLMGAGRGYGQFVAWQVIRRSGEGQTALCAQVPSAVPGLFLLSWGQARQVMVGTGSLVPTASISSQHALGRAEGGRDGASRSSPGERTPLGLP